MARSRIVPFVLFVLVAGLVACGSEEAPAPAEQAPAPAPEAAPVAEEAPPADLDQGIVLALAQFVTQDGKPVPGAARLEFLRFQGGEWTMTPLEDGESNVFHKAMVYEGAGGASLLTLGGTQAVVKTWVPGDAGLQATTRWKKDFGGKWSRMRDAEVGDLYGDGGASIAVATHDQGVVAVLKPQGEGFEAIELGSEADTFVHEIEIGDLDADGVLEVYATPSEPNRLDGSVQTGQVVRYVPSKGEGPVVVADLKDRHAKEILVTDLDGDGTDELYVAVEGHLTKEKKLEHPVEIRRYDADTPADAGSVVATLNDQLTRFLTVGDIEGDGRKEMVAAAFSSGLWLIRPTDTGKWSVRSIDRKSSGFEHASILADLDGDGKDELYVASDKHKEVRRYTWNGRRLEREVIYVRPDARPIFTWNLMPVPVGLMP
jgi:hypothetical protein